jgi:hypothetical protein
MMILPLLNFKEYVPSEIEAQVQAVDWTLAARYTFLFNLVYFMLQWHLGSRSYPKSPSVCSIPRPSLMPEKQTLRMTYAVTGMLVNGCPQVIL